LKKVKLNIPIISPNTLFNIKTEALGLSLKSSSALEALKHFLLEDLSALSI
jgi:hypothetical protein